jgi:hypothetical protein
MTQGLSSNSVTRVTVEVTGSGISTPITYDLVKTNGTWGGIIHAIPAGTNRTFSANAFDATNALVYSGSVGNVTIAPGTTAMVAILLQQVTPPPPFMNAVPVIDSLVASSNEAGEGDSIDLDVSAHDADAGDTLTYTWSATGGSFTAPDAAATSWIAPAGTGNQMLTIHVTDSKGATAALSFTIAVTHGRGSAHVSTTFNTWPQVVDITADPTRIDVGDTTALTLDAIDNDGDPLTYAWTATCSGTFDSTTAANPHFTLTSLPASNSCALAVTVSDGHGGTTTGTLSIQTGPGVQPNFAPVVDSAFQSVAIATGGEPVTFAITAHDPDGTPVTIAWSANAGTLGAPTVSGPGESTVVWTAPACFDSSTTPTIAATITDATGVSTTFAFIVTPVNGTTCVTAKWTAAVGGYLAIWGDGTIFAGNSLIDPATGAITPGVVPLFNHPPSIWVSSGVDRYMFSAAVGLQAFQKDGALAYDAAGAWGCCDYTFDPLVIDPVAGVGYHVADGVAFDYDLASATGLAFVNGLPPLGHLVLANSTTGFASAAYSDNNPSITGHVLRYDLAANQVVWDLALSTPDNPNPALGDPAIGFDLSVYVTSSGLLAAISPDGAVTWQRNDVSPITHPILDGAGHVLVGTTSSSLDAYNVADGTLAWSVPTAGLVSDLLAADHGLIWAVGGGRVIAVDAASGSVRTSVAVPGGSSQLQLRAGTLYVGGVGTGQTVALSVSSAGYDPAAPWPVHWHDNQHTSNLSATMAY